MGIQKLQGATARALRAAQTLTDPASVIKELIDNALDANATSVAIEIHANTLDIISVRDNGHGIAPEDRPLVAVAGCTSKIADIDDLDQVGGTSLGFRGQALASVAELSGVMTVSTRVEGEAIATVLTIARDGTVHSQETASMPVGTTIKIVDFQKANPVRRIEATKNAERSLRKIKHLLQCYAFARPHVRLSLRVLKAKSDKFNFVYAPQLDRSMLDVAAKVVGTPCASQYAFHEIESGAYAIASLLASRDADLSKVSGHGAFVSVDTRSVSSSKGTFKQLVRQHRNSLCRSFPDVATVKDPFLYLEITCPDGAYDPNVEPAKDDLLFTEPEVVIRLFESLLTKVYGLQDEAGTELPTHPSEHRSEDNLRGQYMHSQGRSSVEAVSSAPPPTSPRSSLGLYSSTAQAARGANRANIDAFEGANGDVSEDDDATTDRNDVSVSNPWVFAKLHTVNEIPRQSPLQLTRALPTPLPSSSPWNAERPRVHSDPHSHGIPSSDAMASSEDESSSLPADPEFRQDGAEGGSSHSSRRMHNGHDRLDRDQIADEPYVNKPFELPSRLDDQTSSKTWVEQPTKFDVQVKRVKSHGREPFISKNKETHSPFGLARTLDRDIRDFGRFRASSTVTPSHQPVEIVEVASESSSSPEPSSTEMQNIFNRIDDENRDSPQSRHRHQNSHDADEGLFVSDDETQDDQTPARRSSLYNFDNPARPLPPQTHLKQTIIDPVRQAHAAEVRSPQCQISKADGADKVTRDKTYLLPLERITPKRRVHNLVGVLHTSHLTSFLPISRDDEDMFDERFVDYELTFEPWTGAVDDCDRQSGFANLQDDEIEKIARRSDSVTKKRFHEEKMPEDLIESIMTALRIISYPSSIGAVD